MFNELFSKASTRRSHSAAPFAEERQRYLRRLSEQGYQLFSVQRAAAILLMAAYELRGRRLAASRAQIAAAAERAERAQRNCGAGQGTHYRRAFVRVTTGWLQFCGRLRLVQGEIRRPLPQLDEFCRWMDRERGLSVATIANRRWHAQKFLDRLASRRRDLASLTPLDVDKHFAFLRSEGLSRVTIKIHANAIRSFVRYAEGRGWCSPRIADAIHGPRLYSQATLPIGPSWEDVQRLLAYVDKDDSSAIRDRAILLLFAVYGLRANEVAKLRLDDIDWKRHELRVTRTKLRRVQVYPLAPTVAAAIIRYLDEVRPQCAAPEVFMKLLAPAGPMNSRSLYAVVAERIEQAGLRPLHRGPHSLRHACAGRLLDQGLSLKEIGDHLGHHSANSTRIYAKVNLSGLREVADFDLGEVA